MRRILSFNDFALFEYQDFTYGKSSVINEQVYLDEVEKRPYNEAAFKKFRRCMFMLNSNYPFFSGLLSKLMIRENKNLRSKTMATDGFSIHYDPDFVLKLSDDEIIWVIAHEVLHNSLFHFSRCPKDENKALIWNYATDYALNQLLTPIDEKHLQATGEIRPLKDAGIGKFIEGSLYPGSGGFGEIPYDKEFVNRTAEWIYNKLIENGFVPGASGKTLPPTPPPPPPAKDPEVGDIIFDKSNNTHGIVKSIDVSSGEIDYEPIPKDKVREYMIRKKNGEDLLAGDDTEKEIDF